jgi:1-carboxybiuret hydrolase
VQALDLPFEPAWQPAIKANLAVTLRQAALVTDFAAYDRRLLRGIRRRGRRTARIAGAMVPATLVNKAQKFRRWYRARVLELFAGVDVILAPATPCAAPLIGQQTFVLDGVELPVRANLGIYTQPISFIGLPVVAVPVPLKPMPIGLQIIAAPWREDVALKVARALERAGVVAAPAPTL